MPLIQEEPRSAVTKSITNKIKSIIEKNACFTIRQVAQMTNLSLASVHFMMKKILKVAHLIPHLLIN